MDDVGGEIHDGKAWATLQNRVLILDSLGVQFKIQNDTPRNLNICSHDLPTAAWTQKFSSTIQANPSVQAEVSLVILSAMHSHSHSHNISLEKAGVYVQQRWMNDQVGVACILLCIGLSSTLCPINQVR